jgi:hypothetical protein
LLGGRFFVLAWSGFIDASRTAMYFESRKAIAFPEGVAVVSERYGDPERRQEKVAPRLREHGT